MENLNGKLHFLCNDCNAFYSWVCTFDATKRCLVLYFYSSDLISDEIYLLIKMAAINKEYILFLALRTIIQRMKRRRLQRNSKKRHCLCPQNLQRGEYGCFNTFFKYQWIIIININTRHQHKVQNQENLPGVVKTWSYKKEKINLHHFLLPFTSFYCLIKFWKLSFWPFCARAVQD